MPFFQDKWEALSERTKKVLEIIFGVGFALVCMFFLTRPQAKDAGFVDLNLIIAALSVLLLPKVVQTQVGTRLQLMNKTMLITLIVLLVLLMVVYFIPGLEPIKNLLTA